MMGESVSTLAAPLRTEGPHDDWIIQLSRDDPGRVVPDGLQWAEYGPFFCFFKGLLSNREELENSSACSESYCSDADLVLRAYEQQGEAVLTGLRGSFVLAIIDRMRSVAIVARDPFGNYPLFYVEVGSSVLFAAAPQTLL